MVPTEAISIQNSCITGNQVQLFTEHTVINVPKGCQDKILSLIGVEGFCFPEVSEIGCPTSRNKKVYLRQFNKSFEKFIYKDLFNSYFLERHLILVFRTGFMADYKLR